MLGEIMIKWHIENIEEKIGPTLKITTDKAVLSRFNKWITVEILESPVNFMYIGHYVDLPQTDIIDEIIDEQYNLYLNSINIDRNNVERFMLDISRITKSNFSDLLKNIRFNLFKLSKNDINREDGINHFSHFYLNLIEIPLTELIVANYFLIDIINKKNKIKKISEYKNLGLYSMEDKIIHNYSKGKLFLSGYNRIVRNAIAHGNVDYWSCGDKINFIDEFKGKKRSYLINDEDFRASLYLLYNSIRAQLAGLSMSMAKDVTEVCQKPMQLSNDNFATLIRDFVSLKTANLKYIFHNETGYELPEYYIFNINIINKHTLKLSVRVNNFNEQILNKFKDYFLFMIKEIYKYCKISYLDTLSNLIIELCDINNKPIIIIQDKMK